MTFPAGSSSDKDRVAPWRQNLAWLNPTFSGERSGKEVRPFTVTARWTVMHARARATLRLENLRIGVDEEFRDWRCRQPLRLRVDNPERILAEFKIN